MTPATTVDGHFKGDAYAFTGKTETIYGGQFDEAVLLEGHLESKLVLIAIPQMIADQCAGKRREFHEREAGFARVRKGR